MKASIRYEHQAHYYTSHLVNRREKDIWIVLHGYGQLSSFFLKKFEPVFSEDILFLAPEATNYSYLQGFSGRVGANWMTKHEREAAIANNNRYLNAVLQMQVLKFEKVPNIHILGFSQGAATATRWAAQLSLPVTSLVLWSGGFAHDLDLNAAGNRLRESQIYVVQGAQDEFITEESKQKQAELISTLGLSVNYKSFDGGHELNMEVFKEILLSKECEGSSR
ncbi:MAG: alpha/beta hydrolase [Mongoliitalea sp.]